MDRLIDLPTDRHIYHILVLPRIIAVPRLINFLEHPTLTEIVRKKLPPNNNAPPPSRHFFFLISGISVTVNLCDEAEMGSDPVKVISDNSGSDTEH